VASLLLEGASPSHADSAFKGAFALHVAACNCRTDAIQLLLVAGADVNAGDASGKTALDYTGVGDVTKRGAMAATAALLRRHGGATLALEAAAGRGGWRWWGQGQRRGGGGGGSSSSSSETDCDSDSALSSAASAALSSDEEEDMVAPLPARWLVFETQEAQQWVPSVRTGCYALVPGAAVNGHAVWRMESFSDDDDEEEGGFMFARGSGGSSMDSSSSSSSSSSSGGGGGSADDAKGDSEGGGDEAGGGRSERYLYFTSDGGWCTGGAAPMRRGTAAEDRAASNGDWRAHAPCALTPDAVALVATWEAPVCGAWAARPGVRVRRISAAERAALRKEAAAARAAAQVCVRVEVRGGAGKLTCGNKVGRCCGVL
jgi:hypothetical protein